MSKENKLMDNEDINDGLDGNVDEDMDIDVDDEFNDAEEGPIDSNIFGGSNQDGELAENDENNLNSTTDKSNSVDKNLFELPDFTRKDKTLNEILELMDDNAPIIPDAVIDYYMMKNGFDCTDTRVKRLLALATQKFISDIASDAYEYSRIRSTVAVNNANNGQSRARQLMVAQQQQQQQQLTQQQQQQNEKSTQSKVVLTVNDLSSAVAEYGLNISRPDFYR